MMCDYRYGFQGQEEDPETGLVNYKYRMHDPRIGRFFAVDPLAGEYAWNSPYAFSENSTIRFVELEGLEKADPFDKFVDLTRSFIRLTTKDFLASAGKNKVMSPVGKTGEPGCYICRIGRIFEDAVLRSAGFNSNTKTFRTKTSIKGVKPDAVLSSKSYLIDIQKINYQKIPDIYTFNNAHFVEVKFKSFVATEPSENISQLTTMVDVLAEMKGGSLNGKYDPNMKASDYGAAVLTVITPSNGIVDQRLINYATKRNVQIDQVFVKMDENDNDRLLVEGRKSLNVVVNKKNGGTPVTHDELSNVMSRGISVLINWKKK